MHRNRSFRTFRSIGSSSMPAALLFVVWLATGNALGATIILRGGATITGEVLQDTAERVVVDLGYEVLTIPRRAVEEIVEAEEPGESDNPVGEMIQPSKPSEDLYGTAELPAQSVKQLTERFAEGVVLVSSPAGQGSGFFINPAGYFITNFHVIEGEQRIAITVFRKSGTEFRREKFEDVDIIATNSFLDLALLKVNLPDGYTPTVTYFPEDEDLRDGDPVFAIGNPLGLERSVSEGIVSRRNRAEEGLVYIQTTTQINPGNSGGPLFNARGQVVGVTNMKLMGGEGLGFAIPIRYVVDFLKNREAFAYNSESSEAGYRYVQPPARLSFEKLDFLKP